MSKITKSAKELLEHIVASITIYDKNEASAIAFRILENFNISRSDALTGKEIDFTKLDEVDVIINRINHAEPIQYILKETEFYGRKFKVNKHVLIPRPETEELIDLIIKEHKDKKGLRILDIGTGSGCIPITLAKELPGSVVYSVDISPNALDIAKENSTLNDANVDFSIFDILHNLKFKIQNFDIIVSNPPYITEQEKKDMHKNVLNYEPHLALFVPNKNPLLFYTKILNFCQIHLKPGGEYFFEINQRYGEDLSKLMRSKNFQNIKIIKDLNGKDRIAQGKMQK